jgi:hypothetical protein
VRSLREADVLGKLKPKLAHLQRPQLLILDEAGFLPLDRTDANRLLQVVSRRYTRGSTIVTSNKSASEWAELFGDAVLAAAILDRLLHDAEVLTVNGLSYRLARTARRPGSSELRTATARDVTASGAAASRRRTAFVGRSAPAPAIPWDRLFRCRAGRATGRDSAPPPAPDPFRA